MALRAHRWIAVLVAAVTLVGAISSAVPAAAADGTPWTTRSIFGLVSNNAASCYRPTTCWAIEAGTVIETVDGGQHWTERTSLVPAGVRGFQDISCVTGTTRCYLYGYTDDAAVVVRLDGDVMTLLPALPHYYHQEAISCPTATTCVVIDGLDSNVTVDSGQHWTAYALGGATLAGSDAVDCIGSRCWVVGDTEGIKFSSDSGRTWTTQTAPKSTLNAISCTDTNTCYAAGATPRRAARVLVTHNGGQTWIVSRFPALAGTLNSIDCPATGVCTTLGATAETVVLHLDHGSWVDQSLPGADASVVYGSVTCATHASCVVLEAGTGWNTADGGTTWTPQELPEAINAPTALSCPSTTHCVGAGASGTGRPQLITSDDAGVTWTLRPAPDDAGPFSAVDCATVATCVAVSNTTVAGTRDSAVHAAVTHDGGATWQAAAVTGGTGTLKYLTCPTTTSCLAAGTSNDLDPLLMATTDGGASWHAIADPDPVNRRPTGLACGSATACVLTDGLVYTSADLGQTWTERPYQIPSDALDCSGRLCVSAGENGACCWYATSRTGGNSWGPQSNQMPTGPVSCGSNSSCAVISSDNNQYLVALTTVDAGRTWTQHALPPELFDDVEALACNGTSCIAAMKYGELVAGDA